MVSCQSPGTLLIPPLPLGLPASRIGGCGVNGGKSRQHEWVVVVIELVGEEVCPGEAVIFRAVVAVVLVRGKRVSSEAVVLRHVSRQPVVVTEQDWFSIAAQHQLGRNGPIEGPYRVWLLRGHAGMELQRDGRGRIDAGIQARRNLRIVSGVGGRGRGRGINRDHGRILRKALVRPDGSRRTSLDWPGQAGLSAYQSGVKRLLRLVGLRLGRGAQ